LPENVPANEFLNLEGQKISTSKNWAVWLHEYLDEFPEQQDVLRYVLTANAPETKDNDFTWDEFQARNNNELVAIYGNFINRVLVLTHKYYGGIVPEAVNLSPVDQTVLDEMALLPQKMGLAIEQYRFREASQILMQLARLGNKYLADAEPWKLIKTDAQRVATIMHTALQIATGLSILSEPILPFTAKKLKKMLQLDSKNLNWQSVSSGSILIDTGHQIGEASLLFQKIENEQMEQQRSKLKTSEAKNKIETLKIAPLKPTTEYPNFEALDLKVATVIAAEKVNKTKKLLQLTVDLGDEQRTVVSGIAQDFKPDDLIGKQVSLLTNLHPRTLKGIESNGMILLGENAEGSFVFVNPENKDAKKGVSIH
jgi:methionyl-tRNA synthetase